MDILNLLLGVVVPAGLGFVASWATTTTKIEFLMKAHEELKAEVKDFRRLTEDMAVVKNDIHSIKDMLSRYVKENE